MPAPTQSNPFASGNDLPEAPSQREALDFGPILWRWEKLRLAYNIPLIALVVLLTAGVAPSLFLRADFVVGTVIGGTLANICYLLGPATEAYGRHFRIWHSSFTVILFLAGLGLTILLALFWIVSHVYPAF